MHRALFLTAVASIATTTAAYSATPVTLGYFLPKTQVAAAVQQTVVDCDDVPRFDYAASIDPKGVRDIYVDVDAKSGFLANRATTVEVDDDGLITGFNGKTESQAGPLLVSVIKAGVAVAAAAANPVAGIGLAAGSIKNFSTEMSFVPRKITVERVHCKGPVADKVGALKKWRASIIKLNGQVANGDASAATATNLAYAIKQANLLTEELSQSTNATLKPILGPGDKPIQIRDKLKPIKFEDWLELKQIKIEQSEKRKCDNVSPLDAQLRCLEEPSAGADGYLASIAFSDTRTLDIFKGSVTAADGCQSKGSDPNKYWHCSSRDLLFRRPVIGTLRLAPLGQGPCDLGAEPDDDNCAIDKRPFAASIAAKGKAGFAQLAGLTRISTGGGGIFGSRTVKAAFGAYGQPKSLSYELGSGASTYASVIDAATAGGEKLAGAELAAAKRMIDQIETTKKLRDAIEDAHKGD